MAEATTATRVRTRRVSSPEKDREDSRNADRVTTKRLKRAVIVALNRTKGNTSAACEEAGVGRTTYYRWLKDDPKFFEEVEAVGEKLVDDMETLFIRSTVEANDRRSMRWFLERKGRKRGYARVDRRELTGEDGGPIRSEGSLSIESLREELPEDAMKLALLDILKDNPDLLTQTKK